MLQSTSDSKKEVGLGIESLDEGFDNNDVEGGQEDRGVNTESGDIGARRKTVESGENDSVEGVSQQAEQAQVPDSVSGDVKGDSTAEVPVNKLIDQISEAINGDGGPTELADAANLPKFEDQG